MADAERAPESSVIDRIARPIAHRASATLKEPLTQVVVVLIGAQLALRGWALFNSWFYWDDFILLIDAAENPPSLQFLFSPHDSQLMPAGRLAAWIVGESGTYNWPVAAGIIVGLQLLASVACWWMLRELFGARPAAVLLLAAYLFSPMTLAAFMWWAAAINAVPLQLAFFLAVGFYVRHLRTGSRRDLAASIASQVMGLLFFVKAALIVLPLVAVTVLWFGDRDLPWGRRITGLLKRYRLAVIAHAALIGGYAALYLVTTPNPLEAEGGDIPWGDIADVMLRVALPTSFVGGPWEWDYLTPPNAIVGTPEWLVTATWVAIAVALTLRARSDRLDPRAIGVVLPYVLISYVLVARARGLFVGEFAGREVRYLADSMPVLVLGVGLLLLPLSTQERPTFASEDATTKSTTDPTGARPTLRTLGIGVVIAVLALGAARSTFGYVLVWQQENLARGYIETAVAESERAPLRLADIGVPERVLWSLAYPDSQLSRFFIPADTDRITAVTAGNDLSILDGLGIPRAATVTEAATSRPGPVADCGYALGERFTTVPIDGAPEFFWWMEVYYLAADDTELVIEYAEETTTQPLAQGAHRLFVEGSGVFEPLRLRVTSTDTLVCVDRVNLGAIEPVVGQ